MKIRNPLPFIIYGLLRTIKKVILSAALAFLKTLRNFISVILFSLPVGTILSLSTGLIFVFINPALLHEHWPLWWMGWVFGISIWAIYRKRHRKW
jgi:integral membrane sensor domain MASE1